MSNIIKITENTDFSKTITITIMKTKLKIGIKTIAWLRMMLKRGYKFFEHSTRYSTYKKRSRGKVIQRVRKTYRLFMLVLGIEIEKDYDKRKVYTFYHHKRQYNTSLSLFERLKQELKQACK